MIRLWNYFYNNHYKPAAILALRLMLWGFDWVMPEESVEDAYEVISKYMGRQYRLPDRTAAVMNHLNLDQQAVIFNNAWELRCQNKAVDRCIDQA
jgi:hypothetical protein